MPWTPEAIDAIDRFVRELASRIAKGPYDTAAAFASEFVLDHTRSGCELPLFHGDAGDLKTTIHRETGLAYCVNFPAPAHARGLLGEDAREALWELLYWLPAFATGVTAPLTPDDFAAEVQKRCRGYLHWRGLSEPAADSLEDWARENSPGPEPPSTPEARSASGRVELFGRHDKPIVDGNKKDTLTNSQYDVVLALLNAGDKGLTKDELDRKSSHGDARKILKRLADGDPDWGLVVSFPGTTGKGYRII